MLIAGTVTLGSALAASGNLPGGTSIEVTIDDPVTSTTFYTQPGETTVDVGVSGEASVGEGVVIKDTTVVYVMDVSGSMTDGAGVNCDGIPGNDSRLVCEKEAVESANTAAADPQSSVDETGLASFASGSTAHDVDLGTSGPQLIVAPGYDGNGNSNPDLEDVAFGLSAGGATCYSCGLNAARTILGSSTNPTSIVIFMSDGGNNTGPHVNTVVPWPLGTTIHSFAIGSGVTCTSDPYWRGSLNHVAALTPGGTCTQVTDMSKLADVITQAIGSTLDSLEIEVDGGGKNTIDNADINPDLPQDGPATVGYSTMVSDLGLGDHEICVTANGTDAGGSGAVTECVTIHVYGEADGAVLDMYVVDPPPSIDVSDKVPVTVREEVHNYGPFGPAEFTVTFTATAPDGCNIVGPASIIVPVSLPVSENTLVEAIFTIHCEEPSEHTFRFDNEIAVAEPYVIDPSRGNNFGITNLTVASIAYADVEISDWAVPLPYGYLNGLIDFGAGDLLISETVSISTTKTLHNIGPWGPVYLAGEITLDAPGIDVTGPDDFSVGVLRVSVPVDVYEDFEIHCYEPSQHTITLINEITDVDPDEIHIVDPNPDNDRVERTVDVECVIPVPVDIKPTSCRNPFNVGQKGVTPVAILGTAGFDVTEIDPASVSMQGVSPLRWSLEDVATPYEPYIGKQDAFDCTEEGPDGYMDLTLHFDTQELAIALDDVSDGDVLVLHLRGFLKVEFGSHLFYGEDVIVIIKKGKN
jgi:hypothetical protein